MLAGFMEDSGVLENYLRQETPDLPSGILPDQIEILAAAFPEAALEYCGEAARDSRAPWPRRAAAMDLLGVLARGGGAEVKGLYLSVATGEEGAAAEWATALLGRYYHGDDVQSALYARALGGSPSAIEALGCYPGADAGALKPAQESLRAAWERMSARVALLREPDARRKLGEVIRGGRILGSGDRKADVLWAVECAARFGYEELAPLIREKMPGLGNNIGSGPEEWEFWDIQVRETGIREAVRALACLRDLKPMERKFHDYAVLSGSRESARIAVGLRSRDPGFREIVQLLESMSK